MANKKVEVELVVDSKGAVVAVKTADGELLKLKQTTEEVDDRTRRLSASMKVGLVSALVAVGAAARGAFRLMHESVQLAGIQQIAERKLEQALRNTGDASEESAAMLKALATELQGVSNFGDDAVITAQAMLLSFQEVAGAKGAALLTPRLADLAAGVAKATGETIDLNQAAATLGKSLSTGAGSLKEYGISLTKAQESAFNSATGLDKVRILTEIIDSNFAGLAAATRDSFVVMYNAIGDLKETLGSELRPELEQTAEAFTEFLQDARTIETTKAIGSAILATGREIVEFFQTKVPYAIERYRLISAQANAEIIRGAGFVANALTRPVETFTAMIAGVDLPNPFQKTIEGYESLAANAHDALIQLALEEQARRRAAAATNEQTEADKKQTEAAQASLEVRARTIEQFQQVAQFVEDPLNLPDPLEVFDLGSIGAVNDALSILNYQLERVGNQEARNGILEEIKALEKLRSGMEGVADTTNDAQNEFTAFVQSAQLDLEHLGSSVVDFTLGFIQAKLAEAMAGAIAKEFATKGLVGAITGGLAVGAVNVFFSMIRSKIPKFNEGVDNFGGGLALVGDDPRRGGSGELVALPRGSSVIPAQQSARILDIASRSGPSPAGDREAINRQTEVLTAALQGLGDRVAEMRVQLDLVTLRDAQNRQGRQMRAFGNTAG